jgi:hypothetical protein
VNVLHVRPHRRRPARAAVSDKPAPAAPYLLPSGVVDHVRPADPARQQRLQGAGRRGRSDADLTEEEPARGLAMCAQERCTSRKQRLDGRQRSGVVRQRCRRRVKCHVHGARHARGRWRHTLFEQVDGGWAPCGGGGRQRCDSRLDGAGRRAARPAPSVGEGYFIYSPPDVPSTFSRISAALARCASVAGTALLRLGRIGVEPPLAWRLTRLIWVPRRGVPDDGPKQLQPRRPAGAAELGGASCSSDRATLSCAGYTGRTATERLTPVRRWRLDRRRQQARCHAWSKRFGGRRRRESGGGTDSKIQHSTHRTAWGARTGGNRGE